MTRTEVAEHLATRLSSGRKDAVRQAAAWLLDSGRTREVSYLAADVASIQEREGYLLARITSARPLSKPVILSIENYLKQRMEAKEIEIVTVIDTNLIGGVKIETPTAVLDESVRTKLRNLAEGMSR